MGGTMTTEDRLQYRLENLKEDGIHVDTSDPYSVIRALEEWLPRFKVIERQTPMTWPLTLPHRNHNTYMLILIFFDLVGTRKQRGESVDEYVDCANLLLRRGRVSVWRRLRLALKRQSLSIRHELRLARENIDYAALYMANYRLFNEMTIDAVLKLFSRDGWSYEGLVLLSYLYKQFPQNVKLGLFLRKMAESKYDVSKVASAILDNNILVVTSPPYSKGIAIAESQ